MLPAVKRRELCIVNIMEGAYAGSVLMRKVPHEGGVVRGARTPQARPFPASLFRQQTEQLDLTGTYVSIKQTGESVWEREGPISWNITQSRCCKWKSRVRKVGRRTAETVVIHHRMRRNVLCVASERVAHRVHLSPHHHIYNAICRSKSLRPHSGNSFYVCAEAVRVVPLCVMIYISCVKSTRKKYYRTFVIVLHRCKSFAI